MTRDPLRARVVRRAAEHHYVPLPLIPSQVTYQFAALVRNGWGRGHDSFGPDLAIDYIRGAERAYRVPADQRLPRQDRETR